MAMRGSGADGDVEDDALDDDTLWRLLVWGGVAIVAIGGAVLASQTERGAYRLASLFQPEFVASIEPAPQVRPRLKGAPSPSVEPSPHVAQDITGASGTTPTARGANPSAPAPSAGRERVVDGFTTITGATAADSAVTSTDFGLDVGSDATVDGLRALWLSLRQRYPNFLASLRPVIAVREIGKSGTVELRLVLGPFADAAAAARLCGTLTVAGQSCEPTVFDGQRLALR
jgi:hypothetical protein